MADFERLLVRTSRTFALAIPHLPDDLRRQVGIAYLLFRIADTFEDAAAWPRADRTTALAAFRSVVEEAGRDGSPNVGAASGPHTPRPPKGASWRAAAEALAAGSLVRRPCDHDGYLELLREIPAVLTELQGFAAVPREAIVRHTLRTAEGMSGFVSEGGEDGSLRLRTLGDLRRYCYTVAGIVGELLTELFIDAAPSLRGARGALWDNAGLFGEGLQLVNILKDANDDAHDGRVYLPPGVDRDEVMALASSDLRAATEYVLTLQREGAPRGVVSFTALPVLLARATLKELERVGAGAKISRDAVMDMVIRLDRALDAGSPALAV